MSRDMQTSGSSTRRPSRKHTEDTVRECPHPYSEMKDLGGNAMETGRVCWCPKCDILGTMFYENMTTDGFNQKLRGK